MHGTLSEGKLARLRTLRERADLYFDTGDAIKAGNLAIPLFPESVWPALDSLGCTASVLGNRETHVTERALAAKINGAKHPILCANLRRKDGARPFMPSLVVTVGKVKVGVLGVMVPMVTERMKTQALSAYLWDSPIATAIDIAHELRPKVDLVIALTHIGHRSDVELARRCPEIDIILGGHSHTVLEVPEKIENTYICQGGSHSRYAGLYDWQDGQLTGFLEKL